MWHEARKQEKKIRGMLVDYKRRAERRREYYERIKLDPTQFIQLHGRTCKIHLDPSVHYAAEAPGSMMPWRGDTETMIDRFDVRAHLDDYPQSVQSSSASLTADELWEERQANYERYRILVQNEFLGVREEKFLNQIHLEELYGPVGGMKSAEEEKKALVSKKAAIGFVYDDAPPPNTGVEASQQSQLKGPPPPPTPSLEGEEEDSGDESDSDIDLDLTVDVLSLTNEQQRELNVSGVEFGLRPEDFMDLISRDLEEAETLRIAKEHEDEKAMFSGRKSRKERRALKKKHLDRRLSPPSYAARSSPTYQPYNRSSKSCSRSPSPLTAPSKIKFITSFGGDSDPASDTEGGVIIIPQKAGTQPKSSGIGDSRKSGSGSRSKGSSSVTSRDRSRSSSRHRQYDGRFSSRRSPKSSSSSSRRDYDRHSSSQSRYRKRSRSYSRSRSRSRDRWKARDDKRKNGSNSKSQTPPKSRNRNDSKKDSDTKAPAKNTKPTKPSNPAATASSSGAPPPKLPSPPRMRYYGRRGAQSDSEEDNSEAENEGVTNPVALTGLKTGSGCHFSKPSSLSLSSCSSNVSNENMADKISSFGGAKANPQERLRKKMQALLKKQYKADKKLEKEKAVKAEQERHDREEELREMAIKLRRRERERRHMMHGSNSDDSSRSRSRSHSKSPESIRNRRHDIRNRESDAGSYERENDRYGYRENDWPDNQDRDYKRRSRSRSREGKRPRETEKYDQHSRDYDTSENSSRSYENRFSSRDSENSYRSYETRFSSRDYENSSRSNENRFSSRDSDNYNNSRTTSNAWGSGRPDPGRTDWVDGDERRFRSGDIDRPRWREREQDDWGETYPSSGYDRSSYAGEGYGDRSYANYSREESSSRRTSQESYSRHEDRHTSKPQNRNIPKLVDY